jgi:hypothetical protein
MPQCLAAPGGGSLLPDQALGWACVGEGGILLGEVGWVVVWWFCSKCGLPLLLLLTDFGDVEIGVGVERGGG